MRGSFEPPDPQVVLWQPDRLHAAMLLRFANITAGVAEFDQSDRFMAAFQDRPLVLMVGSDVLRQPDHLRFIHQIHRKCRVMIIGCGPLDAEAAQVASELGVAAIVSTIHDARRVAPAVRRFLHTAETNMPTKISQ